MIFAGVKGMHEATALPQKDTARAYVDWAIRSTMTCGATVVLGKEATAAAIEAEAPDAVIIAVGAGFARPQIDGIDLAPASRQRMLTSLVSVARDLLVYTVAEGVETAEEADVCMRIGFTHAQGYFFGRPRPIDEI